ncbi:MAG: glycosyltransferase [Candidatus Eisenbacteria bacterium]
MDDGMAKGILILGSAQYSDRSWVNCQQIASRLAARHRVLFVDSVGLRAPRVSGGDLGRIFRRLRDASSGVRRAADGVYVSSPLVQSGRLLSHGIALALRRAGIVPTAVIAYLPTWVRIIEMFPQAVRIYHCVDAFAENPGVDRERIDTLERRLLRSVDTALTVSEPLRGRLSMIHPDVRLAPNVADVEGFEAGGPLPADLASIPRPHLLYLGNLAAYKIDLALIEALARAHPAWSFILVGPTGRGDPDTDLAGLRALTNVHLLGERDRGAAPAYVAAADVCLLPLRASASTASSHPLKTYEYLAAGKPVVATPIPALHDLIERSLIRGAQDALGWSAALEAALDEGESPRAARRAEARRHGWDYRIREIEELIART